MYALYLYLIRPSARKTPLSTRHPAARTPGHEILLSRKPPPPPPLPPQKIEMGHVSNINIKFCGTQYPEFLTFLVLLRILRDMRKVQVVDVRWNEMEPYGSFLVHVG